MTTPPPLAALASRLRGFFFRPTPPELPPTRTYILTDEMTGLEHVFTCAPEHVSLALSLLPVYALSDTCREALAWRAAEGRLPARYGEFWELSALGEEA